MSKKITYLLLLLCFPVILHAQENFKHGFLINENGDSIHMLIDDKDDVQNSLQIHTKTLFDPPEEKYYNADMITGYQILPGKRYVSAEIEGRFLFLRALVMGKLDLLVLRDANKKESVYLRNGEHLVLLYSLDKRYLTDRIGHHHEMLLLKKTVDAKLDSAFNSCTKVKQYIAYAEFKLMAIARLIKAYNECSGKMDFVDLSLYSNQPDTKISVYGGLLFSRVAIKDLGLVYFDQSEFKSRTGLKAGISFELHYRSWNPGLCMILDACYQQKGMQTIAGNVYNKVKDNPPVPLDIRFKLNYLDLGLRMQYRWTNHKISPYLSGGLIAGYLLNAKSEAYYAREHNERAGYVFNEENESAVEAGFHLQMGLSYHFKAKRQFFAGLIYENTSQVGVSNSMFKNRSGGLVIGMSF